MITRQNITLEGKIKLFLTLSLLVYSVIISIYTKKLILMPMLMSTAGDIFLMKRRGCFGKTDNPKIYFKKGVFCFSLAHILYAINMDTKISNVIYVLMLIILLVIIFSNYDIFDEKAKATSIYVCAGFYACILIMDVVNTFFFNKIAFIGGILFFISDGLIALFMLLKKKGNFTQLAIWATYVPAQILMLSSFLK